VSPSLRALLLAIIALPGCSTSPAPSGPPDPEKSEEAAITILVPIYIERQDTEPKRLFTLTLNGTDITEPKPPPMGKRTIRVKVDPEKPTAELVMTFWPKQYSKTVRTKRVQLTPGKEVFVDFDVEDPQTPDVYEPIFEGSPMSLMREVCRIAQVTDKDVVMDIGCGDGRMVLTALADFKARKGIGLDINPDLIKACQENAKKKGVADRAEFRVADALKLKPEDVAEASVVFIYLGEDLSSRLEPVLRKLKPGSRIVSMDFAIGKWKPDSTETFNAPDDFDREYPHRIMLWKIKEPGKE
jgi:SAM-dependent methyltransferase